MNTLMYSMIVDQPVGTGFSYVQNDGYAKSLTQVGEEFLIFIRNFVTEYPEYDRKRHNEHGPGGAVDVYIAGESFAGEYIPYIANKILSVGRSAPIQLLGIAIGNGDMDPRAQSGSEVDTLVEAGIWKPNGPEVQEIKSTLRGCQDALAKDEIPHVRYPECDAILNKILKISTHKQNNTEYCINSYDFRLEDTSPACGMNWPNELAATYTFLRKPEVRKALHVDQVNKPEAWVECNTAVSRSLRAGSRKSKASVSLLPQMLESQLRILLFAGDKDIICNYLGLKRMVDNLEWSGKRGLDGTPLDWRINGELVGTWHTDRNLTFVRVHNASHMVAYDQPLPAHDMMLRFMDLDMNLGADTAAFNTSTVGLDARILVPDRGKTHIPSHATPSSRFPLSSAEKLVSPPTSTATDNKSGALADRNSHFDLWGNVFVIALVALAVAGCLLVRRRVRMRPARYQAVEPYQADMNVDPNAQVSAPPSMDHDMEMEPFALGDEEEITTAK
ncbi:carboxypeptidase D [Malassezia yamatoensis]|uniref:Pheromone-processing carboxypeptidase KEX1 n=1 Tax=Malassezia yamatoensis TaxID=253288 RepID=A0AAJ5YQL0_9BASI|nr:carboxypeptidase D [Malassezia yamatoensis]